MQEIIEQVEQRQDEERQCWEARELAEQEKVDAIERNRQREES